MNKDKKIIDICRLIRYYILASTTEAGSGHPTSSLSAVELVSVLFFNGYFKFRVEEPEYINNDRLIFSKGHASPLLYSLWAAAGALSEKELLTLRDFDSGLEGHPTPRFRYTEAATGSLGQGLSVGLGMALAAKKSDNLSYNTFVLLGDSEMAEGSQWEAMEIASYYNLDNLIGILDVNRLGQRGETMYGTDISEYEKRISAFGWKTVTIKDGHDVDEIDKAYGKALKKEGRPVMLIAKTVKGKGVSLVEDKDGWHGKALDREQYKIAMKELGQVDNRITGGLAPPDPAPVQGRKKDDVFIKDKKPNYKTGDMVSTRKAYGESLARMAGKIPQLVVLDAEVSNSTYSEIFKKKYPERFFEMYVAEQNMAGTALGMSLRGKIPFISTFAAFFTRAYDQIRMSQYSDTNIKFCGSHAGVSIGADGSSQMGLEDISMFRSLLDCAVLYPSDAVSTEAAVWAAASCKGNVYIRTTRMDTPVIYEDKADLQIGKSIIVKNSPEDSAAVIAGGVTLHEALKAYEELKKTGIALRIIDIFSIKPIDSKTILDASRDCSAIITVEDHYSSGGIGEAVKSIDGLGCPVYNLAVKKMPRSGTPGELLEYEEISKKAIISKIKEVL